MPRIFPILLLAASLARIASAATPAPADLPVPILVELFTSEGCSSCPPADALLARLRTTQPVSGADIIVLEEHVDYWENLGWHDRFSSSQFTDRQSTYAQRLRLDSNYTPQMIVDGTDQFVGNDSAHALRSIERAAHTPKLALHLSPITLDADRIHLSASAPSSAGGAATPPRADLFVALIQTSASTKVASGENGGRTLTHVSVVRSLQKIGTLTAFDDPIGISMPLPKDTPQANLRVVVFAQRAGQGAILAAAASANLQ